MAFEGMEVRPKDPKTVPCEWCRKPSVRAIPHNRMAGTHIYVCADHIEVAEKMNTMRKRSEK